MPKFNFIYGTDDLDIIGMGGFGRVGATDGDDWIYGDDGGDWISGLDGNDILQGDDGADKLFGNDGIDTAIYSDSPKGVHVDLHTGEGDSGRRHTRQHRERHRLVVGRFSYRQRL